MARPKDKGVVSLGTASQSQGMSQAFANKSQQEEEKLQVKVASGLKEDLISLFEQEWHSDLIVTNGSCEVRVHQCILQARAKELEFAERMVSSKDASGGDVNVIRVYGLGEAGIRDFMQQLYYVNDAKLLLEDLIPLLEQEAESSTPIETPEVSHERGVDGNDLDDPTSEVTSSESHHFDAPNIKIECNSRDSGKVSIENKMNGDNSIAVSEDTTCEIKSESRESEFAMNGETDFNKRIKGENCTSEKEANVASEVTDERGCEQNELSALIHTKVLPNDQGRLEGLICNENKMKNGQTDSCAQNVETDTTIPVEVKNKPGLEFEADGNVDNASDANHLLDHQKVRSAEELECEKGCDDTFSREGEKQLVSGEENDNKNLASDELKEKACDKNILMSGVIQSADNVNILESEIQNNTSLGATSSKAGESVEVYEGTEKCITSTSNMKSTGDVTSEFESSKSTADISCFINPYRTCSPLGNDLLCLYLQHTLCDCCLSVEGVHLFAHKCVLSARSPYFNAMFGGRWSESKLEVVYLEGITAPAMEKVLLFFYGGVIDVISSSDLFDLFVVADMYGVDTMKLVLQFFMRKDLCHFFHKPCATCICRAPEALNLCHAFHLEELQDRLLKWVSKHFTKIWITKAFACLSDALHQLCVEAVISQMTKVNVLDIIMDCDRLMTSLPRVKWTEPILCLTTQLMDSAIEYTSTNFIGVIHAPEFLTWAKVASWKASALEEIFNSVIDSLPVDTAISVYQTLLDLKTNQTMLDSPEENLLDLLETMIKRCEKFLRTHIHMVTRSKQWSSINKTFQSQILESSSYFHLDHFPDPKPRPKRPVMTSSLRKIKARSGSPSSASSAYTASKSSKTAASSSSTGQRPIRKQAASKTSATKSKASNITARGEARGSENCAGSGSHRPPSQLSKALASSAKPSPKTFPRDQSSQEEKSNAAGLGASNVDKSGGKAGQLSSAPKLKPVNINNPNHSHTRLSSSLPSDKHFVGMGRSPPSRLPLKTSQGRAHEYPSHPRLTSTSTTPKKTFDSLKESSSPPDNAFSDSTTINGINSIPCLPSDPAPCDVISQKVKDHMGDTRVVSPSEQVTNVSHAAKFDSANPEEGDWCRGLEEALPAQTDVTELSRQSSSQNDGQPDDRRKCDTLSLHQEDLNRPDISYNGTVLNGSQSQATVFSETSDVQVCVQQETNFVKVAEPVKVSFVIPGIGDE